MVYSVWWINLVRKLYRLNRLLATYARDFFLVKLEKSKTFDKNMLKQFAKWRKKCYNNNDF